MSDTQNIQLTLEELRAVSKSLAIGCDQLLKKLERLSSRHTRASGARGDSTLSDYKLLKSAREVIDQAIVDAIDG
jgi:hypothetical protein